MKRLWLGALLVVAMIWPVVWKLFQSQSSGSTSAMDGQ